MTDASLEIPAARTAADSPEQGQRNPAALAQRGHSTIDDLVELYVGAYKGRDSSRLHYLRRWCERIGARRIDEIDADSVAEGLQHFASTPARRFLGRDRATGEARYKVLGMLSAATLNRMRSTLSALLRFAKRQRLTPKGWVNPVAEIEAHREDNERTRFLSELELKRLLAACKASSCGKLYLLVLMALSTGARRGELLSLRYGDLQALAGEAPSAHVRRTKNGKPRVLPLTPAVARLLLQLGDKPAGALVFCSRYDPDRQLTFSTAWRAALRRAQVEDFRFHDLRHSCASYLAQSGASLLEIADVLGHKTMETTRRYAHLTTDSKRRLINREFGALGQNNAELSREPASGVMVDE